MKVVIFEYISSGLYDRESLYTDLMVEADLMVNALGQGMVAAGCEVVLFRDPSWAAVQFDARIIPLAPGDDWNARLEPELHTADAFVPIAPETDAMLENLCRQAEHTRCLLLNTSAAAVRRTANKSAALKQLTACGIPCVACDTIAADTFPAAEDRVIKPLCSAACENTFLIRAGSVPTAEQIAHTQIHQPYLSGTAASLSVIYGAAAAPCILGVNQQEIGIDKCGGLHLKTCRVNALADLVFDFEALATAVQQCFGGLLGYVGIDFVIHNEVPYVLEINPRLTTSFAGLAQTTATNPCALLIAAARGLPFSCPPRRGFSRCTIDLH